MFELQGGRRRRRHTLGETAAFAIVAVIATIVLAIGAFTFWAVLTAIEHALGQ